MKFGTFSIMKSLAPKVLQKAFGKVTHQGNVPISVEIPSELPPNSTEDLIEDLRDLSPIMVKPDVYLISYPKCGRTWLRLMLGYAFVQHFGIQDKDLPPKMIKLTWLADLHRSIPRIKASHEGTPDKVPLEDIPRCKDMYKDADVILMVRDPRDVAVSNHFQRIREATQKQRWHGTNKQYLGSIQQSIRDHIGGIKSILHYYDLWAESQNVPKRMLVVRYEDLWQHTQGELERVLDFLGLSDISSDTIAMAVRYGSFENMRKLELTDELKSEALRPGDIDNPETYKTRKGIIGDYLNHLTQDDIEHVNGLMRRSSIATFGYRA